MTFVQAKPLFQKKFEKASLLVFIYIVFTCMRGESYCRQFKSLRCCVTFFPVVISSTGQFVGSDYDCGNSSASSWGVEE